MKYLEFLIRALKECVHADIIHCNDLNALPVGVVCKMLSFGKIKLVYDAHELETERNGLNNKCIRTAMGLIERMCLYFADR